MKSDREVFKKAVKERVGREIYFLREITTIVRNLGYVSTESHISKKMKDFGIVKLSLDQIEVWPGKYSLSCNLNLYDQEDVWKFLKHFETEGRINMERKGIKCFEDLIEANMIEDSYLWVEDYIRAKSWRRKLGQTYQGESHTLDKLQD